MTEERATRSGGEGALAWDPWDVTIHEALRRVDGARSVFRRFGVDLCCGGELPVAVAAEHHGVDLGLLLDALAVAEGRSAS